MGDAGLEPVTIPFEMRVVEDVQLEVRMVEETGVFPDAMIVLDKDVGDVEAVTLRERRVPRVVAVVLGITLLAVLAVVFNEGIARFELDFN